MAVFRGPSTFSEPGRQNTNVVPVVMVKTQPRSSSKALIKDAYFLIRNPKNSGKQPSSAFRFLSPYFLSFEGKKASFWGGTKKNSPRVVHVLHLSTRYKYTIRSGLWAVIFSHFHPT